MKRLSFHLIGLLACFSLAALADTLLAQERPARSGQITIEGTVTNGETGEPLRGAHVFLSGTTTGTITDEEGRYRLQRVHPGMQRLTATMVGYERFSEDVMLQGSMKLEVDMEMQPTVYELDPVFVDNLDDRWERYLDRFYRLFVGESEFSDEVYILNPDVLRFNSRWWGRFTARAVAPLVIENRALGYRITFFMDEFWHSGNTTRWDGEPFFEELEPENEEEEQLWAENREKAFQGSLRHFFLSLIYERATAERFHVYRIPRTQGRPFGMRSTRITPENLIRESDENPIWNVNFSGRIRIVYTGAGEDERYVDWARDVNRRPASIQTSYLSLNERPITVDQNGEVLETYGATRYGYLSFRRIAELTPREYRPGDLYETLPVARLTMEGETNIPEIIDLPELSSPPAPPEPE